MSWEIPEPPIYPYWKGIAVITIALLLTAAVICLLLR